MKYLTNAYKTAPPPPETCQQSPSLLAADQTDSSHMWPPGSVVIKGGTVSSPLSSEASYLLVLYFLPFLLSFSYPLSCLSAFPEITPFSSLVLNVPPFLHITQLS